MKKAIIAMVIIIARLAAAAVRGTRCDAHGDTLHGAVWGNRAGSNTEEKKD